MAYILNVETATKNCSIAIAKDGEVLICKEIAEEGYSHAERLHVFIEESLQAVGIEYNDLTAVAISQGPGSYTGLRIGVSAAKGLCYALSIPLIAVDTLESLAAQADVKDGVVIPMIDARRMEVYSAVFSSEGSMMRNVLAEVITEESFSDIQEKIYFVGDCNEKCKTVLTADKFTFLDVVKYPSAREMAKISQEKFINNETVDVAYFEPFYLKDFMITAPKKK
jgi:tRNA threonylcarbamoyladenosine biosynthesis protein TsaB